MDADLWIWNASEIGRLPPATWRAAGVKRIYLKCGDGRTIWPQFRNEFPGLKALGFEVYGWQYVYGEGDETGPAVAALQAGADGFIIDAEGEWEVSVNVRQDTYVGVIRRVAQARPILLSSFGQPDLHRGMHWPVWDGLVDGYIPQVFPQAWNLSISDAITKMYRAYQMLGLTKPLYPAAYLYPDAAPVVKGSDVTEFFGQAQAGGYERVSFWRDGIMGQDCADAIAALFPAPTPPLASLEDRVAKIEAFLRSFPQFA